MHSCRSYSRQKAKWMRPHDCSSQPDLISRLIGRPNYLLAARRGSKKQLPGNPLFRHSPSCARDACVQAASVCVQATASHPNKKAATCLSTRRGVPLPRFVLSLVSSCKQDNTDSFSASACTCTVLHHPHLPPFRSTRLSYRRSSRRVMHRLQYRSRY